MTDRDTPVQIGPWATAWCVALLALPLWWVLGIEQFVWPVLAAGLAIAAARQRAWKVVVSPVMVLWLSLIHI